MPKIDVAKIAEVSGSFYPEGLGDACLGRHWKQLGDAAGLTQFGANLVRVEPGAWSSL
ncbi:MAG: transcriptional regulator, partial [Hyphomicrobiales bacterium]|nr:transcriptional regulator [Hyphomicrobiales bacterium]